MAGRIFIHAVNIHTGGGAVLLQALLQALPPTCVVFLLIDKRFDLSLVPPQVRVYRFPPQILHRLHAEWLLFRMSRAGDTVFCFGNLPPLLPNRGRVILYLHNRYLLEKRSLRGFSWKARLRMQLERWWLQCFYRNVDKIWVQTASMGKLLQAKRFGQHCHHAIAPFMAHLPKPCDPSHKKYDFIYVASSEPHKNHRRLIEAWCILAEQGLYPHLCLTLSLHANTQAQQLLNWIAAQEIQFGLKITHIVADHGDELLTLYHLAHALIYPSLTESFGLPLLEAKQQGLSILAGELDYVRDVIVPNETFDPHSAVSIARAVQRFLGIETSVTPLLNPGEFVEALIGDI